MARLGSLDYEAAKKSDLIPDGDYAGRIIESSITPTKKGDGKILLLVFDIAEGPEKGRRHWERLNIQNASVKTQTIATRQLIMIAEACGVPIPVTDSDLLHNKPIRFTIGHRDGDGQFGPQNTLKKVWAYAGAKPAEKATAAAGAGGGGASKPADAMPWD